LGRKYTTAFQSRFEHIVILHPNEDTLRRALRGRTINPDYRQQWRKIEPVWPFRMIVCHSGECRMRTRMGELPRLANWRASGSVLSRGAQTRLQWEVVLFLYVSERASNLSATLASPQRSIAGSDDSIVTTDHAGRALHRRAKCAGQPWSQNCRNVFVATQRTHVWAKPSWWCSLLGGKKSPLLPRWWAHTG